jgi:hypothetical protein
MLLERVQAVRLAVHEIVEQVDDAGQRAEDGERGHRAGDRIRVEQLLAEDQPREDDQVLRPLVRTKRGNEPATP